jgi:hypothetical protein
LLVLGEQNMSEAKALVSERRALHIVSSSEASSGGVKVPEPFVSAEEAARFLSITRRTLLVLARKDLAGAYPIGTGAQRKVWVFCLSEVAAGIASSNWLRL